MKRLRVLFLSAAGLFLISNAVAETAAADTATFISACAADFETCRKKVVTLNNYNTMIKMGFIKGKLGCSFPRTESKSGASTIKTDSTAATKAILVWLTANRTSVAREANAAIAQAEKALWPTECH